MKRVRDRELVRYLAGGLGEAEAAALRRRIEADPGAARRLAVWERTWRGLELPPPGPVPAGFAGRLRARLAGEREERVFAGLRPAWARTLAAAALVAGLGLGSVLGLALANGGEGQGAGLWSEPALAEISWAPANGAEEVVP